MKKFLHTFVFFVGFAVLFYIVALLLAPQSLKKNLLYTRGGNGHLYSRIQELKTKKPVEILFLGSSHAYRGFDTRIFDAAGLKSFNLGSSAQSPMQTYVLASKYLSTLKPRLVVYEVNPRQFSSDGMEPLLDLLSNEDLTMETLKMTIKSRNIIAINTLIYSSCKNIRIGEKFSEKPRRGKDTYIPGGFVERDLAYHHPGKYKPERVHATTEQLYYFDRLLADLKKNGIKVLLVQAPITSQWYKACSTNEEFDSTIRSRQLPYYNFNKLLKLDDSLHFYDKSHLNQNGVRVFNEKLLKLICQLNLATITQKRITNK